MTNLLPAAWLPAVPMRRIHGHWTAGHHKANATDRKAYHILIEGDGTAVRGTPSIAANSGGLKDGYAAHTLNANSDAIGVSMCGMAGAIETPFNPGVAPLTAVQWNAFVRAVAELAAFYRIPVGPKTILFHAEVQANLGIAQKNKWDVARLPFLPGLAGARAIGDRLRAEVAQLLAGAAPAAPAEPVPEGATVRTIAGASFHRAPGGEATGHVPAGTEVAVVAIDGDWLNVTTPAGYTGFIRRDAVVAVDGPKPLDPTRPDARRQAILDTMRDALDRLEAELAGR